MRATRTTITILTAAAAAMTWAAVQRARAHDMWADGASIPAWVQQSCCGPADAHLLEPADYWIDSEGFHVRGLDAVKPIEAVQPSQDGRVWAFYNAGLGRGATLYCVFYLGAI